AVRPDQAENLALVHGERDVVDRPQGAEPLREAGYAEHGHEFSPVSGACPARDAARERCIADAGPRLLALGNRDPGSAAHHFLLRCARDTERHHLAYACPLGSGSTASTVLVLDGQAILVTPSMYCITTGEERSFWPDIWLPGG